MTSTSLNKNLFQNQGLGSFKNEASSKKNQVQQSQNQSIGQQSQQNHNYNQMLNSYARSRNTHNATYSNDIFQDDEERNLHEKILSLYDLIQQRTLANLLLKKQNDDLELQIQTINQIKNCYISFTNNHGNPQSKISPKRNKKQQENRILQGMPKNRNRQSQLNQESTKNEQYRFYSDSLRPGSQASILKTGKNSKMIKNAKMKTINTQINQDQKSIIEEKGLDSSEINENEKYNYYPRNSQIQIQQNALYKLNQKRLSKNLNQVFQNMKSSELEKQKRNQNRDNQFYFKGDSFTLQYDQIFQNNKLDQEGIQLKHYINKQFSQNRKQQGFYMKPDSCDKKQNGKIYLKLKNYDSQMSADNNASASYLGTYSNKETSRNQNTGRNKVRNQGSMLTKRTTYLSPRNQRQSRKDHSSKRVFNNSSNLRPVRSIQQIWNNS